MGAYEFIVSAIPILLSILVPGLALAFPFLRKSGLSLLEIACFGFALGLVVPTTISYSANVLLAVPFSLSLTIISALLTTLIGIAIFAFEYKKSPEAFKFEMPAMWVHPKRDAVAIILLAIVFLAFFIRVQSFGSFFYEFDPYYYMYIARQLIVLGHVPQIDWTAWYPGATGHGSILLTGYLEAGWYAIVTGGASGVSGYNNLLLSSIANIYPPIAGAFICFFAYILVKEEYGKITGILAAGFMAVTPRLIEKFAAGEAEITPWGMFSSFFFVAAYALAVNRNDKRMAVLAGIAYMSTYFGSAYTMVVTLVFVGYSVLESLKLYLVRRESLRSLIELNSIVLGFVLLSYLIRDVGYSRNFALPSSLFLFFFMLAGMGALYAAEIYSKTKEMRYNLFIALAVAGVLLLAVTPAGGFFSSYIGSAIGFAKASNELMQTVAEEQAMSPDTYKAEARGSFGILGPLASELTLFSDIPGLTWLPNIGTIPLGFVVGLPDQGALFVPFLLILSFLAICYAVYRNSNLAILFLVLIFPISYVGLQKSKYNVQFGFMLVIAFAVLLGEAYRIVSSWLKDEKSKRLARDGFLTLALAFLLVGSFRPLLDVMPTALSFKPGDCTSISKDIQNGADRSLSSYLYCAKIPAYWLDPMEWINKNVERDARVLSWWDYGHWINFFGDRPSVTRNEHANSTMDLMVADSFVEGTVGDMKEFMKAHNATHVLFDIDLVGKWGALRYLSCVYNQQTNMSIGPGGSTCDRLYDFEYVYVPSSPSLNERCVLKDGSGYMQLAISTFPVDGTPYRYCVGNANISGNSVPILYNTDASNPPGDFDPSVASPNRGLLAFAEGTYIQNKPYTRYMVLYPEVWYDGQSGLPDRKGKGYDSNFYKGFFLGKLDGFDLVYPENDLGGLLASQVRIFKIKDS